MIFIGFPIKTESVILITDLKRYKPKLLEINNWKAQWEKVSPFVCVFERREQLKSQRIVKSWNCSLPLVLPLLFWCWFVIEVKSKAFSIMENWDIFINTLGNLYFSLTHKKTNLVLSLLTFIYEIFCNNYS